MSKIDDSDRRNWSEPRHMYMRTFVNITDLTVLAWTVSVAREGIWRQLFDSSNEKYRQTPYSKNIRAEWG